MIEVRQTEAFASWLESLADERARTRIAMRILRLRNGLFGDVKRVTGGVSELRIDYGPGYRVYFIQRGRLSSFYSAAETSGRRPVTSRSRLRPPNSWSDRDAAEDHEIRS